MSEVLEPEYGYITFQDREVVAVGELPRRMKVDLEAVVGQVLRGVSVLTGGVIAYGRHEDGGYVWYEVTGWDPETRTLILELDIVMREVGKRDVV